MPMTVIFVAFAAVAALCSLLMPHLAHGLGYTMAVIYLGFGVLAALIYLARPTR